MATATALFHPKAAQQTEQFYPFTVTVKDVSYNDVAGLVGLACAYEPAAGGPVETFEEEAPTQDRILLMTRYEGAQPKQRAFLNQDGVIRRFTIDDVLHVAHGTQTMLIVTPMA